MLWLRILGKVLSALKEGATPAQLALGFVLGWAFGLVPGWPAQVWAVLLVLLVLQANLAMAVMGWLLGGAVGWLADPALDALGAAVLRAEVLRGVFTAMYNAPPWALTRFNNTAVMGATVAAAVTAIVLFPLVVRGVGWYRGHLLQRLERLPLVQALQGTRLFGLYRRLQELGLV